MKATAGWPEKDTASEAWSCSGDSLGVLAPFPRASGVGASAPPSQSQGVCRDRPSVGRPAQRGLAELRGSAAGAAGRTGSGGAEPGGGAGWGGRLVHLLRPLGPGFPLAAGARCDPQTPLLWNRFSAGGGALARSPLGCSAVWCGAVGWGGVGPLGARPPPPPSRGVGQSARVASRSAWTGAAGQGERPRWA